MDRRLIRSRKNKAIFSLPEKRHGLMSEVFQDKKLYKKQMLQQLQTHFPIKHYLSTKSIRPTSISTRSLILRFYLSFQYRRFLQR